MSDEGIWRNFSLHQIVLGQEKGRKITEKQPKHELLLIQSQNNGAGFTSGLDKVMVEGLGGDENGVKIQSFYRNS